MQWLLRKIEVITHSSPLPPFSFRYDCYIGCCWEERVEKNQKIWQVGGNSLVQSGLAAGNAKKVGVGKLYLLCVVLLILCLFWEADLLCRGNTLSQSCPKSFVIVRQAGSPHPAAGQDELNQMEPVSPCICAAWCCERGNEINLLLAFLLWFHGCLGYLYV